MSIHPTAVIGDRAAIGANVTIGPYAVIEDDAVVGPGCEIGAHAVIKSFTRLGQRNRIAEHATLGGVPQDVKFKGEKSFLNIGDDNLIREFVTIHRGSAEAKETAIGSRNFLMVGVHIAHDCTIGDDNVFVNGVALAGHIEVEDHVFLSSNVGVHQFSRIGRFAMVGGQSKIVQDILPFFTTDGNPPFVHGLNVVGLRRAGFTSEQRRNLKRAYRLLLRSNLSLDEAVIAMSKLDDANVDHLIEFVKGSKRGFVKAQASAVSRSSKQ